MVPGYTATYRTQLPDEFFQNDIIIEAVYINKQRCILARTPNDGEYFRMSSVDWSGFQDRESTLDTTDAYYKDTRVWYRKDKESYDTTRIEAYHYDNSPGDSKGIFSAYFPSGSLDEDSGYYLEAKLEFLDHSNEWFHYNTSSPHYLYVRLVNIFFCFFSIFLLFFLLFFLYFCSFFCYFFNFFLRTPNDDSPAGYTIEAVIKGDLVTVNYVSSLTISNITFYHSAKHAIAGN